MTKIYDITGQCVRHKNNDNAPSVYSAPSSNFKAILKAYADPQCERCCGTGYIGSFKMYSGGRCYKCLPEYYWNQVHGEVRGTGTNDRTGKVECQIIYVCPPTFTNCGFAVVEPGHPPLPPFSSFETYEEACEFAKQHFDV